MVIILKFPLSTKTKLFKSILWFRQSWFHAQAKYYYYCKAVYSRFIPNRGQFTSYTSKFFVPTENNWKMWL